MFYIVSGEGYRSKNEFDNPIKIYKEFKNKNPFIARKKAFDYFQSLVDVLLEGIGKEYITYEKAEKDLIDYYASDKKISKLGLPYIELGLGFNITFISDETIIYEKDKLKIYKNEKTIHGIENEGKEDLKEIYLKNLIFEKEFYQKNGYIIKENNNTIFKIISSPINFNLMYIEKYLLYYPSLLRPFLVDL